MKWNDSQRDHAFFTDLLSKLWKMLLVTVLLLYAVFHVQGIIALFQKTVKLMSPFVIGLILAFIGNLFVTFWEEKIRSHGEQGHPLLEKHARMIALIFTLLLSGGFLLLLLWMILPEVVRSVRSLTLSAPEYLEAAQNWMLRTIARWDLSEEQMKSLQKAMDQINWTALLGKISSLTTNFVGSLMTMTATLTSGMFRFLLGVIFSVYLLAGKEQLLYNCKRILFAFLSRSHAEKLIRLGALSNRIFSGFVTGQCTEAVILGVLCYLGMLLFRLPYPLLISVVVGITGVIPIFGAYIGAAFGGLLLLLIRPVSAVCFLVFLVILQNLEGDLIYPKVVGNSVGLPGIWVVFSIFFFGELFGFLGMLLGVPVTSVLYALLKLETEKRLQEKDISIQEIRSVETFPEDLTERPPKILLEKEQKR